MRSCRGQRSRPSTSEPLGHCHERHIRTNASPRPARVNSEQFLSQRHAVVTIERFNWIVEQPFYRTSVSAKHGEEQGYEPKARRACIKVIAMKSLAPGLGNAVRGKGGAKLRELAHSTTPRTRAWVEECLDRYFNDKTFSKNQYIKIRGIGKPYRDGQLRREEEAAVGKMRATLATLATLHAAEEPVEVAAPPPGPRPRVLIPPRVRPSQVYSICSSAHLAPDLANLCAPVFLEGLCFAVALVLVR